MQIACAGAKRASAVGGSHTQEAPRRSWVGLRRARPGPGGLCDWKIHRVGKDDVAAAARITSAAPYCPALRNG